METKAATGSRWAEPAYDAIATVYDDFTAHHDYDLWLGNLLPKLEAHGLSGDRLLDVACGTGKGSIFMIDRGWEVTATDISAGMVEAARAKMGDTATFAVADMTELPTFGEFDLVWCLDDAVNYLLSVDELERALSAMRRNLAPTGLLMFDVNTIETYRTFFTEEVSVERAGKRLTWRGLTPPEAPFRTLGEARFEIEPLDGGGAEPPQLHRQRHFPEEDVLAALESAGLEFLDLYGHHHDAVLQQPLDEINHSKAVYMARRAR